MFVVSHYNETEVNQRGLRIESAFPGHDGAYPLNYGSEFTPLAITLISLLADSIQGDNQAI
jgi:hypothetical protein